MLSWYFSIIKHKINSYDLYDYYVLKTIFDYYEPFIYDEHISDKINKIEIRHVMFINNYYHRKRKTKILEVPERFNWFKYKFTYYNELGYLNYYKITDKGFLTFLDSINLRGNECIAGGFVYNKLILNTCLDSSDIDIFRFDYHKKYEQKYVGNILFDIVTVPYLYKKDIRNYKDNDEDFYCYTGLNSLLRKFDLEASRLAIIKKNNDYYYVISSAFYIYNIFNKFNMFYNDKYFIRLMHYLRTKNAYIIPNNIIEQHQILEAFYSNRTDSHALYQKYDKYNIDELLKIVTNFWNLVIKCDDIYAKYLYYTKYDTYFFIDYPIYIIEEYNLYNDIMNNNLTNESIFRNELDKFKQLNENSNKREKIFNRITDFIPDEYNLKKWKKDINFENEIYNILKLGC